MENLESKDWKERKTFYTNVAWDFDDNSAVLQKISRETTVPALEAALLAIIKCPIIKYMDTKPILSHINNIKLKEHFKEYIFALIKKDSESKDELIEDIINSIKTIKLGKTVQIYCEILKNIVIEFNNVPFDLSFLSFPLNHNDPTVRKEGIELCSTVYKQKGDVIFSYLSSVKDLLIKEIKDSIANAEMQSNDIKPENVQTNTVNVKYNALQSNIRNINPSNKIFDFLKSSNYKERLECLREIQNTGIIITPELQHVIVSKIDDANLQVNMAAIECCVLFKPSKDVIRVLCTKMKDKRFKTHVFDIFQINNVSTANLFESVEFESLKNPVMKCGILEYALSNKIEKESISNIISCTEDGNKDVRELALKCCKKISESENRAFLPAKIMDKIASEGGENMQKKEKKIVKIIPEHKESSLLSEDSHQKIYERIIFKYEFLSDKNSLKRHEELIVSDLLTDPQFYIFACSYKDSFYKNNILFIERIMQSKIPKNHIGFIFKFWIEKIGDVKLKPKIVDLILFLSKIHLEAILEHIYVFIREKKVGKLFCEGIYLLGLIGDESSLNFISSIDKKGKNEKEAGLEACEQIKMKKVKNTDVQIENSAIIENSPNTRTNIHSDSHPYSNTHSNTQANTHSNTHSNLHSYSNANNHSNAQIKRKHSPTSSIIKQILRTRTKDCKNKEIIFEESFLKLLNDPGSYNTVLNIFNCEDKIYLSDFIIEYIFKHEIVLLDSVFAFDFIERFLDHLILHEYLLRECECIMLYEIVHTRKDLVKKLEYVYPRSKLERIISNRREVESLNTSILSFNINASSLSSPVSKNRKRTQSSKVQALYNSCKNNTEATANNKEFDITKHESVEIKPERIELEQSSHFINVHHDSILSANVQSSSIDSTKIEKYRNEFFEKNNEGVKFDRIRLERIFLNLIHSDPKTCESAFYDLRLVINESIESLLFSCNSIISSILIQLNDSIITNNAMSNIIIDTLHKLCCYKSFVMELSNSSLRAINIEMMNNLKLANELDISLESKNSIITASADILSKLCLNANQPLLLKVYLSLIEFIKDEHKQILYNLIWNHSKNMKVLFEKDDRKALQEIMDVLSEFLEKNCLKIIRNNVVVSKVIQFHLNEMCNFYRNRIYEFTSQGLVRKIIDKIMGKVEISINDIKDRLEDIKKDFYNKK